MTAVVTGAAGQLGRALRAVLPGARFADAAALDITDPASLGRFDWSGTTSVVNAAAWTAVDAAEDPEKLPAVWDVNVTGVARLAAQARRLDVPLVHVSSDYVFRGDAAAPVPVDAPVDPRGAYAASKAAGELAARLAPRHYVVRTSWVFGDGPNFVRTMLALAATRRQVSVIDDQLGRPTYAVDLARMLVALLDGGCPSGTYHATGAGDVVSWAQVAAVVLEGTGCSVRPVSTADYTRTSPQSAPRPAYSALDLSGLVAVGIEPRDWREALAEYLALERQGVGP